MLKTDTTFAPMKKEQELSLIHRATELFLKYGIRSITMDDVARELGVSKKTIYKYVANKGELVDKSVRLVFGDIAEIIQKVSSETENAIDEIINVDAAIDEAMKAQHPAILFQLRKYYPETAQWLINSQKALVLDQTVKNLNKGVEQGWYRDDFNIEYIAYIYFGRFITMNDGEVVPESMCQDPAFMREHLIYHLRAIASAKGLQYLENKITKTS